MAQNYASAVLTNAGAELLARAQAGLTTINFTKIVTGDGVYIDKSVDALKVRTSLKSQKQSFPLSSKEMYEATAVKVTTVITNRQLSTGYYMNEIGLYAEDEGVEILYSIAVCAGERGDWMPPYNGSSAAEIIQSFVVTVDNALNVTIAMRSDAFALARELGLVSDLNTENKSSAVAAINEILVDLTHVIEEVDDIVAVELGKILEDLLNMAFQLEVQSLIDTSDFNTIMVDIFDTAADVTIISGTYDSANKKVYI
jgi:hypothetical protein